MAIILASKSPRRQELMRLLGLEFTIHTADVDETMDKTLPPEREVARVGGLKAAKIAEGAAPELASFSGLGKVVDMDFYVAKNPYCYFGF